MKNNLLLLLFVAAASFVSCDDDKDDGPYADYLVARPLTISAVEFKANAVAITEPVPIQESGKIYAYQNYIFVNDIGRGIHVIDNSDPSSPKTISFIKIEGNADISIKSNRLFADSYGDLVVFDISHINAISLVNTVTNVIGDFWGGGIWIEEAAAPQADFYDYGNIDFQKEVIIGWETATERRLVSEYENQWGDAVFDNFSLSNAESGAPSAPTTGQGGSLARFKIVGDFLYVVDSHNINVINIENLENPEKIETVYAGFDIETIFNQGQYLFLGSMRGMYIYDISSPSKPVLVSEFEHGTACDPVVVDGDYAFVTLRGGNGCGATESGLFVIDISDISKPTLKKQYPMDGPYGLGIKEEKLFVCDGSSGLKVFDKTDIDNLVQINHFENINTYDVIPLANSLLMIGDKVLYQYEYLDDDIRLLSTYELR